MGVFTYRLEEYGHNMHAVTLSKVLTTLIGGSSQKNVTRLPIKRTKLWENIRKKLLGLQIYPIHHFSCSPIPPQLIPAPVAKKCISFPVPERSDSSPKLHLWGWAPRAPGCPWFSTGNIKEELKALKPPFSNLQTIFQTTDWNLHLLSGTGWMNTAPK